MIFDESIGGSMSATPPLDTETELYECYDCGGKFEELNETPDGNLCALCFREYKLQQTMYDYED